MFVSSVVAGKEEHEQWSIGRRVLPRCVAELLMERWRRTPMLREGRAAAAAFSMMGFGGWQWGSGARFWNNFCRCCCGISEEWPRDQAVFTRWHEWVEQKYLKLEFWQNKRLSLWLSWDCNSQNTVCFNPCQQLGVWLVISSSLPAGSSV